jgi:hypothetical protein
LAACRFILQQIRKTYGNIHLRLHGKRRILFRTILVYTAGMKKRFPYLNKGAKKKEAENEYEKNCCMVVGIASSTDVNVLQQIIFFITITCWHGNSAD